MKISHVNNLTDARYFAAAGVRFLGFCCNPGASQYCSVSRISEICQWIEGPEFVLEFDGWQSEQEIETILSSVTVQAVHFGAFSTYQSSFGIPVFKDFIFENIADADFTQVDFPVIRSVKEFSGFLDTDLDIINHKMAGKAFYLDMMVFSRYSLMSSFLRYKRHLSSLFKYAIIKFPSDYSTDVE